MDTTPDTDINDQVEQLLAQHHKIAVIWCTDDVTELRPDLSEDQAWEVLQLAQHKHDASYGIDWTTLEIFAEELYPEASNNQQQGE